MSDEEYYQDYDQLPDNQSELLAEFERRRRVKKSILLFLFKLKYKIQ